MSQSANDIFYNLEGKWHIKRTLGTIGAAEGVANFVQMGGGNVLSYKETLKITFFGHERQIGHQEYKFIYDVEQDSISKYNSSHDIMYQLEFRDNQANGEYLCNLDTYLATYTFLDDNKFTLTYKVTGPLKEHSIITEFEKIVEDVATVSSDLYSFPEDSY